MVYKIRKKEEQGLVYERMPSKIPYYTKFLGVDNEYKTGEVIITEDRLKVLADELMKVQEFAYDTETNSLRVQHADASICVGISISWGEHNTYYIPLRHRFDPYTLPVETVVTYLRPCFKRKDVRIIGQNLKFDLHVLADMDMEIETKDIFDTMVARWLTDENEDKGLKEMTTEIYDIPQTHFDECLESVTKAERKILGLGTSKKYISYENVRLKYGAPYALADAYWTWRHYVDWQLDLLGKEEMETIYKKGSMPFLLTLYRMERRGAKIDLEKLNVMAEEAEKDLNDLEYKILELAGVYPFKVTSSQQVAELLFGYKKFNNDNEYVGNKHLVDASFNFKATEFTDSGAPQTGDDQLKDLASRYANTKDPRKKEGLELIAYLRKHKKLSKLNNAFITGLMNEAYEDGKVRPSFKQCGCLTAETLIPTEQGLFPIGDLANLGADGEFVNKELNIVNRYREVEKTKYVVKYLNRETIRIETELGFTLEGTNNHPIIKQGYKGAEEWARLDNLTTKDYVAIPYGYNTFCSDRTLLNNINKEVAELLGIYQASGSILNDNGSPSIVINTNSSDVIYKVCHLSNKIFGAIAKVDEEENRVLMDYNHKALGGILEQEEKSILSCILQSSKEVILAYLKGLTIDSKVVQEEKGTYLNLNLSNSITARYIQEILLNLGIISSREKDITDNVYSLTIYNADYNKFKELIGFIEKDKAVPCSNNSRIYKVDKETKTVWLKVENISKSKADVYDFNVPETHSFISGAFISHNTSSGRISCSSPNLQQLPRPVEIEEPISFSDWYEKEYGEKPKKKVLARWDIVKENLEVCKDYYTGNLLKPLKEMTKEILEYLEYLKSWYEKNEDNIYWKYYEIRSCFVADSKDDCLIALD